MDIEVIQVELMRYAEDTAACPIENYCHAVLSVIHPSSSDNRVQCDVFYSTELEKCKDIARMLRSQYESSDYYAFSLYVDGELSYSSDNRINLYDQNKSFRYFIET